MDFSEDEADIQDMTLSYTGLEMLDVKIGHHRPPVGFERNTSSNHNMLIERAVPTNLFSANRKIGASASTKAQDYVIGFGVFNEDAGSNNNNNRGEDLSFDSRIAGNLFGLFDIDEDDILHVGLGHSYQKPSDEVRYRARPGIGDGSRFIDTGIINDVDTINVVNAELVTVFDSLSFQGEYFNTAVDRKSTNANFSGYYAQMGYFLTGEKRDYNRSSGLFSRTNVLEDFSMEKGGYGAWELLARFDSTDLSDASAGILGGELDLYTLGLNWYLNKNVRLMSNIIVVDSDENAATLPNDDPTIFKLRAQWDF
jgi:phosphate-selective porin OprO/OprP